MLRHLRQEAIEVRLRLRPPIQLETGEGEVVVPKPGRPAGQSLAPQEQGFFELAVFFEEQGSMVDHAQIARRYRFGRVERLFRFFRPGVENGQPGRA